MKLTKEDLIVHNELYDYEHGLTDGDIATANIHAALVEKSRTKWRPRAGDVLIDLKGQYHHIDKAGTSTTLICDDGSTKHVIELDLCEMPGAFVPFISSKLVDSHATISLSTSGGPWSSRNVETKKLRLLHQKEKNFKFFGHCGSRGNGAVTFPAIINVWQEDK